MKIIGDKINLRTIKITDAQSIKDNISKDIVRFMDNMPFPYTLNNGQWFVKDSQKKWRKKKAFRFGIEDKESKKIIGMIGLENVDLNMKKAEVGYWLGSKHHRKGIMSEALAMILKYAFKNLKLQRVFSRVYHPNIGSYKTLEKAGFKAEGRLRRHVRLRNKQYCDELRYGLLKEEYKKKYG